MTLDLTHLPKGIRERAFDGSHDRIRQVRAANWVGYARATRALDRLEELIEQPSCARMPCLLLYGESGMGKTMIVEKFQRLHPPTFDRGSGVEHRPVLIVQMPSGPDDRRFFTRILHELGVPFSAHWRLGALERTALDALTLARTPSPDCRGSSPALGRQRARTALVAESDQVDRQRSAHLYRRCGNRGGEACL